MVINDSISSSDYPVLVGRMISELDKIWKESVVASFQVGLLLRILIEGVAENMRNLSQDS
jgi:hypothetical protein